MDFCFGASGINVTPECRTRHSFWRNVQISRFLSENGIKWNLLTDTKTTQPNKFPVDFCFLRYFGSRKPTTSAIKQDVSNKIVDLQRHQILNKKRVSRYSSFMELSLHAQLDKKELIEAIV